MSDFQVEIAALRKAGASAQSAGEQLRSADAVESMANVGEALPGSRSAKVVTGLADTWRGQVVLASETALRLGRDMAGAADRYTANDEDARRDLSPFFQWLQAFPW